MAGASGACRIRGRVGKRASMGGTACLRHPAPTATGPTRGQQWRVLCDRVCSVPVVRPRRIPGCFWKHAPRHRGHHRPRRAAGSIQSRRHRNDRGTGHAVSALRPGGGREWTRRLHLHRTGGGLHHRVREGLGVSALHVRRWRMAGLSGGGPAGRKHRPAPVRRVGATGRHWRSLAPAGGDAGGTGPVPAGPTGRRDRISSSGLDRSAAGGRGAGVRPRAGIPAPGAGRLPAALVAPGRSMGPRGGRGGAGLRGSGSGTPEGLSRPACSNARARSRGASGLRTERGPGRKCASSGLGR
jgi:hypothetical protein